MPIRVSELQQHISQLDGGRYKLRAVLGSGAYGMVLKALDTYTGKTCAIKRVSPDIFTDSMLCTRILREIKLLAHFRHENIIGLQNILQPSTANFDVIYIVMDYMETDLRSVLMSGQPLIEEHLQYFTYQILRGLDCIHSVGVLHRDLTPSNILLNTNCDVKICDFGLAKQATNDVELTDYVVMRWYRAPELIMEDVHYGPAIDTWACGCILGEMYHKNTPLFKGKDRVSQLDAILHLLGTPDAEDISAIGSQAAQRYLLRCPQIKRANFRKYFTAPDGGKLSKDAIDLLQRMLTFNPAKRITVQEALNHPYFADLHDPEFDAACRPRKFSIDEGHLLGLSAAKQAIFQCIAELHTCKKRLPVVDADASKTKQPQGSDENEKAKTRTSEADDCLPPVDPRHSSARAQRAARTL